ncbi:MAG TPA: ribose-phosphate diphosphokinase [Candidatus Binataceae bacterium]|nr:ribose-phosphate diphosphokinase [Candidatus Binataceae bacterium]
MTAVKIHAFADSESLARRIGGLLKAPIATASVHRFPDGETLVRAKLPVDREAVVVRSLHDPNAKLIEVLLLGDALRRAGAKRVTLVSPYLPYMRQDKVFHRGEPLSQQVLARLLGASFDRIITLEAHLHRTENLADVFAIPAHSIPAASAIADWIRAQNYPYFAVIGPDSESTQMVSAIAKLSALPCAVGRKHRLADRNVEIQLSQKLSTKGAIVVDDIASSGHTLATIVRALRSRRIAPVDVIVAHALFERGAISLIRDAGARKIISCNSITHPTNRIDIAPLLADALRSMTR